MKKHFFYLQIICCFICFSFLEAKAQEVEDYKYWVLLTDKANSTFSVENPSEFLSQKAIDRRAAYGIAITEQDLPVNENYVEEIATFPVNILQRSKWFNAITISVASEDSLILAEIESLPFVKETQLLARYFAGKTGIDKFELESTESTSSSAASGIFGAAELQMMQCNAHHLHGNGFSGEGMDIAVMDAGFREVDNMQAFAHLYTENRLLGVYDFVENDDDPYHGSSHGTSVLSTMAGKLDTRYLGTAPNANYYLFRTEDVASEQRIEEVNWAVAAEKADSLGVDVLNTSLGYSNFDLPEFTYTYEDMNGNTTIITKAADLAAQRGMFVVNSAGNAGSGSWKYITAPADADSILTVGAVNVSNTKVSFSSFGPTYDGRIKPNVMALGQAAAIIGTNDTVAYSNGTSFSSPIMAGMASCLWQNNKEYNNMQIIDALQLSATLSETPNDSLGYGIPDLALAYFILKGVELENADDILSNNQIVENATTTLNGDWFQSQSNTPIKVEIFALNGQLLHNESKVVSINNSLNIRQYCQEKTNSNGLLIVSIIQEKKRFIKRLFLN